MAYLEVIPVIWCKTHVSIELGWTQDHDNLGWYSHLFGLDYASICSFQWDQKKTRNVLKLGLELSSISRMSNDCSRGNDFSFIIFVISWKWKIKGTWKRNVLFVGYCILGNGIEGSLCNKGGVLYSLNLSIKKKKIYYS